MLSAVISQTRTIASISTMCHQLLCGTTMTMIRLRTPTSQRWTAILADNRSACYYNFRHINSCIFFVSVHMTKDLINFAVLVHSSSKYSNEIATLRHLLSCLSIRFGDSCNQLFTSFLVSIPFWWKLFLSIILVSILFHFLLISNALI